MHQNQWPLFVYLLRTFRLEFDIGKTCATAQKASVYIKARGKVSAIRVIRRILLGGEGSYIAFTGYLFT